MGMITQQTNVFINLLMSLLFFYAITYYIPSNLIITSSDACDWAILHSPPLMHGDALFSTLHLLTS